MNTIEAAKRWFVFVKSLNEREPKSAEVKRAPIPVHNVATASRAQASATMVNMVYCRWCGNLFEPTRRPECSAMNSLCRSRTEYLP